MKYESLQQVFDTVAKHLLDQDCRAQIADSYGSYTCMYRTDSGMKCAVGCLIPDEVYEPDLEDLDVDSLFLDEYEYEDRPYIAGIREQFSDTLLSNDLASMLRELQAVHDKVTPGGWRTQLWKVAVRHGLENDVLDPN